MKIEIQIQMQIEIHIQFKFQFGWWRGWTVFLYESYFFLKSYFFMSTGLAFEPHRGWFRVFYCSARHHFKCQWFSCECEKNPAHSLKFPPDATSANCHTAGRYNCNCYGKLSTSYVGKHCCTAAEFTSALENFEELSSDHSYARGLSKMWMGLRFQPVRGGISPCLICWKEHF